MDLSFLAPGFLWLLLLVPLAVLIPRPSELRHASLRALVLAFVVLALARPVAFRTTHEAHQVFVLDASQSVEGAQRDAARTWVETTVSEQSETHRTFVVEVRDSLGAALSSAASAIPEGARGSVTLVSDGLSTRRDWGTAAQELSARGLPVHSVALMPRAGDLRPVRFEAVGELRVGQTARLLLDVVGRADGVLVRLSGPSGELATHEGLDVDGRARVMLEFEPDEPGFLELTAEVTAPSGADAHGGNERLTATFAVQDPLRLLYLGERMESGAERLGELLGGGFAVDVGAADPTASDPSAYDVVLFDDRPARAVPAAFQASLVSAVQDGGIGLFMSGGEGAFGPGGWQETPVAGILPVEFVQKEEKRDPSTTLVVIIDTSGSMGGNRVQLAKEVARLSIRRLLPHDKVGIVEFYGAKRWAAPIQPASNSIELERALNRLDAGGGTVILPAIEESFYALQNVRTRYKHVLVLTDGGVERGAFEPLLRRMADEGINVSTVLVGPDAHSEFLVSIANWGKGRFYSVPNRFNLPEVLLKQPTSAKLPAYRPGSHALVGHGGPSWWGDLDPAAVPAIGGYVETRSRPGAEAVLETMVDAHPVLSSWRFGLGRVTTLTTEPTGPGTEPWRDWADYGAFLARVLSRTAADGRAPFAFAIDRAAHEVTLRAQRRSPGTARPVAFRLDGSGSRKGVTFDERADGLFQARLVIDPGTEARFEAGAEQDAERTRLVSPARADRSDELNVDPLLALDLERLSSGTGGAHLKLSAAAGFRPQAGGPRDALGAREVRPLLILLALLAWLADIAWRRRSAYQPTTGTRVT